jgi:hypothetical protein
MVVNEESTDEAITEGTAEGTAWRQACREAVATLRDALSWKLSSDRWARVREVIAELASAVSAQALDALRDATETLGYYAPVRVQRRLGCLDGPPPGIVREQIAELVDALEPPGATGQAGSGLPSGQGQTARRGA